MLVSAPAHAVSIRIPRNTYKGKVYFPIMPLPIAAPFSRRMTHSNRPRFGVVSFGSGRASRVFARGTYYVSVASIALTNLGGGPSLAILRHADGHPTFLILLNAHPAPRLLNPLDFFLVQDELARG